MMLLSAYGILYKYLQFLVLVSFILASCVCSDGDNLIVSCYFISMHIGNALQSNEPCCVCIFAFSVIDVLSRE